jgi:hypothetical protein
LYRDFIGAALAHGRLRERADVAAAPIVSPT